MREARRCRSSPARGPARCCCSCGVTVLQVHETLPTNATDHCHLGVEIIGESYRDKHRLDPDRPEAADRSHGASGRDRVAPTYSSCTNRSGWPAGPLAHEGQPLHRRGFPASVDRGEDDRVVLWLRRLLERVRNTDRQFPRASSRRPRQARRARASSSREMRAEPDGRRAEFVQVREHATRALQRGGVSCAEQEFGRRSHRPCTGAIRPKIGELEVSHRAR